MSLLQKASWPLVLFACATIGLSPFAPPHVVEKLSMLVAGTLTRPIDWFDLALHGAPWAVLVAKTVVAVAGRRVR